MKMTVEYMDGQVRSWTFCGNPEEDFFSWHTSETYLVLRKYEDSGTRIQIPLAVIRTLDIDCDTR